MAPTCPVGLKAGICGNELAPMTNSCDQVLIVTSGSGMVATEHEQREINVGDVVHIKAGERHWHGAKANTTMGHITITLVGSQATHG